MSLPGFSRWQRSAPLLGLTVLLAACGAPDTPPGTGGGPTVRALSLPTGAYVTLDLTGPTTLSRGAGVGPDGTATFALTDLRPGPYAVTARAFDHEAQPRVALYKGGVAAHTFGGDTLNLKLSRLTSDVTVNVTGVPNTAAHLKAVIGSKYVGLTRSGLTAAGVLQGAETGTNRLVVVEARALPGGPVTHRGEARLTVQEENAANVVAVALTAVQSPAPRAPLLTGAATAQRGAPYTLGLSVPTGEADLQRIEIDWGDGQTQNVPAAGRSHTGQLSHTYSAAPSGGVNIVATVFSASGVSTTSEALHLTVTDPTTSGNVVVDAQDDVTEVSLRVSAAPAGTTRVTALVRDTALSGQAFKPEYPIELVPDAGGDWTAALGLTRGRAFTVTPTATTPGGPHSGRGHAFTAAGETQTVNVLFERGGPGGGAPPTATLRLLDPTTGRPLSGDLSTSLTVRLAVQASDPEGDALSCALDLQGDDLYETDLGDCSTEQTFTHTFNATGAFTRFVPRLRVSDGLNSVRRAAVVTVGSNPQKWVSGYYPLYESNDHSPDTIGFQGITHLFVGAVMPWSTPKDGDTSNTNPNNWTYQGVFDDRYASAAVMSEAVSRAHAAGKQAVMMVGGSGEFQYWGLTQSLAPARLKATATALLAFLDKHGFDGIDLDYESYADLPLDMEGLGQLAQELRARRPDLLLSFAGNWVNRNQENEDVAGGGLDPWVPRNAQLFDQINMMSYGMTSRYWDGFKVWHPGALYDNPNDSGQPTSVDVTTRNYLGQRGHYAQLGLSIPANKVGIGIGFYGSCYRRNFSPNEVPAPNQEEGTWDGEMSYWRIITLYGQHPEVGKTLSDLRVWDSLARVPYLTSGPLGMANGQQRHLDHGYPRERPYFMQDCDYVSYEDPQSIDEKARYVRALGLGGTIVWSVSQTYIPEPFPAPNGDRNPLLTAMRQAFQLP